MLKLLLGLSLITAAGCVATDYVAAPEEPARPPMLNISAGDTSLLVGAVLPLSAQYTDMNGQMLSVPVGWQSRMPGVATINEQGLLMAVGTGQSFIVAQGGGASDSVLVTVVASADTLAQLVVQAPDALFLDEQGQATVTGLNLAGNEVPVLDLEWLSSDPLVARVSTDGMIQPLQTGETQLTAVSGSLQSAPYAIRVLSPTRMATIVPGPVPGEASNGQAVIERVTGGGFQLRLGSDFRTDPGPGLYVLLADCAIRDRNNLNTCPALELGQLQSTSGAQTYPIPAGTNIYAYSHVLIFCKPFAITFGTGALE